MVNPPSPLAGMKLQKKRQVQYDPLRLRLGVTLCCGDITTGLLNVT